MGSVEHTHVKTLELLRTPVIIPCKGLSFGTLGGFLFVLLFKEFVQSVQGHY